MVREVSVREIMTREFVGVSESDSLAGAVDLLLSEGARTAVVLHGSDPVGLVSTAGALAAYADGGESRPVSDVMATPAPTVPPDASLGAAAREMTNEATDAVLVVGDGGPVGVVSCRDVVSAAAAFSEEPTATDDLAAGGEPGVGTAGDEQVVGTTGGGTEAGAGEMAAEATDYSTQSVCEICGSFSPDLNNFNGQLICADCREI
jgi:CBS domain-containing protein